MEESQFARELRCHHCGEIQGTDQWPERGDSVPFYFQAEPRRNSLQLTCPGCGEDWFVVWDDDPGPILTLPHGDGRPREIYAEARSVDEAMLKLRKQVPAGFHLESKAVLVKGGAHATTASAESVEEASRLARKDLPEDAFAVQQRTIGGPSQVNLDVEAFGAEDARKKLLDGFVNAEVVELVEILPPRKGFLGIGRSSGQYSGLVSSQDYTVKLAYKQNARVQGKVAKGVRKRRINLFYPQHITSRVEIPLAASQIEIEDRFGEEVVVLPFDTYECPSCGKPLDASLYGSQVVARVQLPWGGAFWWSSVSHCGRNILVSNSGSSAF